MLTLTALNECFQMAINDEYKYIGVKIAIGLNKEEIIINPRENFEEKKAYYNQAYGEDLRHKFAGDQDIRITGFVASHSFDDIEAQFNLYDVVGYDLNYLN